MLREDVSRSPEPSVTALLKQLGNDSTSLIRSEIALAKLEAREAARVAALEGAKVGAAVALAAAGGLALVAWLILTIGRITGDHYATAAFIVGIILLAAGAILARTGMRGLRSGALKPSNTMETLQEDKKWASQQVKEIRSEIAKHK